MARLCEYCNELSGSVDGGEFIEQLSTVSLSEMLHGVSTLTL